MHRFKLSIPKQAGEYCLFSLPQSNHYQSVSGIQAKPAVFQSINSKWGNRVAVIRLNDVLETITISGIIEPKPVNIFIEKKWTISDYDKSLLLKYSYLLDKNRFINGNDAFINRIADKITKNKPHLNSIISAFYRYTIDHCVYGNPTTGLYTYKQAVKNKTTDCGGFSTLLLSLLQSARIPSRLVTGFLIKNNLYTKLFSNFDFFILNFKLLTMHAWAEALLPDGNWFPLDPSIEWRREHDQTKRQGGYGTLPADRIVTSFGQDFSFIINGKEYQVDLLQNPVYI